MSANKKIGVLFVVMFLAAITAGFSLAVTIQNDKTRSQEMVFVLFEVTVKKEGMKRYLALAGELKERLAEAEGFIRAKRFSSLSQDGKLLSLSVWENEEAVRNWRNREQHRMSQRQGRDTLFESYTITVLSPIRTYSNRERKKAPEDSNRVFEIRE